MKIAGNPLEESATAGSLAGLAAMTEAVMAVDGEQRILLWNRAAESLFGISAAEALGHHCHDVICGRDRSGSLLCRRACHSMTLAQRGKPVPTAEILTLGKDRTRLWLNAMSLTLRPAGDGPLVLAVIFSDASALKHSEQAVQQLSASVARLLDQAGSTHRMDRVSTGCEALSPREDQVLERLREGFGTRSIADQLGVSPATVKNHVQHIFTKLGAHSRLEAVRVAGRRRLSK